MATKSNITVRNAPPESRRLQGTELRAAESAFALAGIAAAYNTLSRDLGGFREQIAPGAFTRSLQTQPDVMATFNHDPSRVLGRTKSGTLTLADSLAGLVFYVLLDKTNSDHQNVYSSVKRGDISQCSFAFYVAKGGEKWGTTANGKTKLRTLLDVDLIDIAVVTYPAYPSGTPVDARNRGGDYVRTPDANLVLRMKLANIMQDAELRSRLHAAEIAMKKG